LFTELLLILFWMNPFFWIMRRELYAIHEFLADQKAIARHDGAAFAAMILQAAHNSSTPALSNPFFTSHLKRRLIMITTSHAPKYSYLRRISGLVLMVATGICLVLSIDQAMAQTPPPPPPPKATPATQQERSLPDSITSIEVWDNKGTCYVTIKMKDGRVMKMDMNESIRKGYPQPLPPPPPPSAPPVPALPPVPAKDKQTAKPAVIVSPVEPATPAEPARAVKAGQQSGSATVYYYAGNEITGAQVKQIHPAEIEEIQVWKGEQAIEKFGAKGANGVISITPKSGSNAVPVTLSNPANTSNAVNATNPSAGSQLQQLRRSWSNGAKPLILMGNKEISETEMLNLKPEEIIKVEVLSGAEAWKKYGAKAANGVVIIHQGC
jgi:hypothetical protein